MTAAYDTASEAMREMGYDITPRMYTSFVNKTYGSGETIRKDEETKFFLCYYDDRTEKFIVDQFIK